MYRYLITVFTLLFHTILCQDGRVIGGFTVQPEFKYSWMVAIYRYGDYWCGGILLQNNKVITAAHCMGGTIGELEYFEVHLHRHNLTKTVEQEKAKVYRVSKRWVPTKYDKNTYYNDVAVLELDTKDKLQSTVVVDTKGDYNIGFRMTAVGWGAIQLKHQNYPILQEVWLPVSNYTQCQNTYQAKINYTVIDSQICAGYGQGGKDTCQGDSGGPLFTYINDKPILIGITSQGISCAQPNTPALYTKLAKYNCWLKGIFNGTIKESPTTDPFA